jgi:hypothetical protein
MPPLPEREPHALSSDYTIPRPFPWFPDPFDMEYVLDRIDDEGQRKAMLATSFTTMAAIYQALARGAEKAAEIIGGEES